MRSGGRRRARLDAGEGRAASRTFFGYCPCVAPLVGTRVQPAAMRQGGFLLLCGQSRERHLALRALCLHAAFMATDAVRHGRAAAASDVWVQAMVEGASRDTPLAGIVNVFWST